MSLEAPFKPTLKDIARKTGVSPTAVSHVLNNRLGRVRVGQDKQALIIEAARRMGYVPQLKGRAMVANKSFVIGALCSFEPNKSDLSAAGYAMDALRGVEQVCKLVNYHCLFATCDLYDLDRFERPRLMRDGSVDGVVLIGHTSEPVSHRLAEMGLPCVQLGSNVANSSKIECVEPDLDTAFKEMAGRLYGQGHRTIELFLPAGPGPAKLAERFRELGRVYPGLQALATLGPHVWSDAADTREHARRRLAEGNPPTAYLCNLPHSEGLIGALAEKGLELPEDFSIVVFGRKGTAQQQFSPAHRQLALIELPVVEVARQAASRLFELLEVEGDWPARQSKIPCGFIDRPSWGPARRTGNRL